MNGIGFLVAATAILALGVLCIELAYGARMRRLAEIVAANRRDVRRGDFVPLMSGRFAELDHPTYGEMVFDFEAWTYRQFYPREVS